MHVNVFIESYDTVPYLSIPYCGCHHCQGASDPNVAIIHPEAAPGPLDNPLKGYCVCIDAGKIHRPHSMVYFYVP